jgi:hypothetical protein
MDSSKARLNELGTRIREALDDAGDDAADLRQARALLLRRVTTESATRAHGSRLRVAALAATGSAVFASAAAIAIWSFHGRAISFDVGPEAASGRVGEPIQALGNSPVLLNFSDGSSISLRKGGRLRVVSAEAAGARVLIENGGVDVNVVHDAGADTRWNFDAGPYSVRVTGTQFHAAYEPRAQSLSISMKEGAVVVSGPCMTGARTVRSGDTVSLSCEVAPLAVAAPLLAELPPQLPPATPSAVPSSGATPAAPEPSGASDDATSWRELLNSGSRAAALRAAEQHGFATVCRSATLKELVRLADAARLEGRAALAVQTLTVLRSRFASSPEAGTAAFTLGRVAAEQRGTPAEAVRWFETYLAELPNGPLMGDALGRLMESRKRSGDRVGARTDAQRYLRRFPEGPYAAQARGILAE